jgi:hypothetical protein
LPKAVVGTKKMSNLVIDEKGRLLTSEKYELVDRIMKMRANNDPWVVIDELVKYWIKNAPEEVQALKINVSDAKEILIDKKFGQTKGGKDMERRFQLIFPTGLQNLIRGVYKTEELPFDREFYRKFSKKYPGFRVAEKD